MKKLLCVVALAAVGYVVYRKVSQQRDDADLWAEVTDSFE